MHSSRHAVRIDGGGGGAHLELAHGGQHALIDQYLVRVVHLARLADEQVAHHHAFRVVLHVHTVQLALLAAAVGRGVKE
eukprot:3984557-Pyramimonas_sp.AAC.1